MKGKGGGKGSPPKAPLSSSPLLHPAVHQPTQQRCFVQFVDKTNSKEVSAMAKEVKAQMLFRNLVNPPFLRLREVLQDQDDSKEAASRKRTYDEMSQGKDADKEKAPSSPRYYYMIFEGFADGQASDLLEFVKQLGAVPEKTARELFRQLVEAVMQLHSLGIIHGDLKLPNLLVICDTQGGTLRLKIKDFSCSSLLPAAQPSGNPSGTTPSGGPPSFLISSHKGSPAYLAPEVTHLNQPFCGKKADTYTLGVILYTLLVGCYPATAPTLSELFELIRKAEPKIPSSVPKEAAELIKRLMSKKPEDRPTLETVTNDPWLNPCRCPDDEDQLVPRSCSRQAADKQDSPRPSKGLAAGAY